MSDDTEIEVLTPEWSAPFSMGPVSYGITVNGGAPTIGAALPQFDRPPIAAGSFARAARTDGKQESVSEIPLEIDVVIGRAKVSVAKLMAAGEGDRFQLDRSFGEPVELQVNGRLFGYGELVADEHENVIGIKIISVEKRS